MDIIYFIIFAIIIIFMYYLINVIKDLQIQILNMNNTNTDINKIDTIDIKMKKDFISLLDYIKNYFI